MKKQAFVLDSYALLAYFFHEPGYSRVSALLSEASVDTVLYMSLMNCGEVYYRVRVRYNQALAKKAWTDLGRLPINISRPTEQLVLASAELKAVHRLPYLDAFTASLALAKKATIVTGDLDFQKVESLVAVDWLPR